MRGSLCNRRIICKLTSSSKVSFFAAIGASHLHSKGPRASLPKRRYLPGARQAAFCIGVPRIEICIRRVSVADVRRVRDAVLRPDMPAGGSIYPGDDAADTLHVGVLASGTLVSVATTCREAIPGTWNPDAWRLRGMATVAEFRGSGFGRRLAQMCIAHAADRNGTLLWCSARSGAAEFYRSLGFAAQGDPFRLPEYSRELYILMGRPLV